MPDTPADLASRLRRLIGGLPDITEKRMFGSTAFLLEGHILIAARPNGSALVQVGKERNSEALARPGASQMVMRGNDMVGFVEVAPEALGTEAALLDWIALAEPYIRALPRK